MRLVDVLPRQPSADSVYEAFIGWAQQQGLSLYPHQEEAAIELFSGNNAILASPRRPARGSRWSRSRRTSRRSLTIA